ncbi:MAG: ABC transporter ATP-binding protein, partial [Brachymonas sp.]|nr:ABC transporter ATP-binding protein [Brachymonas sp.]
MPDPQALLQDGRIVLRRLMTSRKTAWFWAAALGLFAMAAGILLLAVSGWFITAAALAGIVNLATAYTFNYPAAGAVVRGLAIGRTAGRYGERLVSHNATLALLADLRSLLFGRLANARHATRNSSHMHRLVSDIDLLDEYPLRLALPWLWALILLALWLLL